MKLAKLITFLVLCPLVLNGCVPTLSHQLYNYTGASITIYDRQGTTAVVENTTSHAIAFVPQPGNNQIEGFLIRIGNKQCFYPLYDLRGEYHMDHTPGSYFEQVGLNRVQVNFGVDKDGKLYALNPRSKSLGANKTSQPTGFPVHPQ